MSHGFLESDFIRSLVQGGRPIEVTLEPSAGPRDSESTLPRFGGTKCTDGAADGRWVNMHDEECSPPYCTGNRTDTVNGVDSVSGGSPPPQVCAHVGSQPCLCVCVSTA